MTTHRRASNGRPVASSSRRFGDFFTSVASSSRSHSRRQPAEPETVALYVADLARRGRRPATIARKLAAIAVFHRAAGEASPTEHDVVRAVVRGLRRQLGVAQPQKTALELEPLRTVLAPIPRTPAAGAIARCCSSAGP